MTTADTGEWARQLASQLADLDVIFTELDNARFGRFILDSNQEEALGVRHDGADIPHQYARVISRIIEGLQQLPPFADDKGLVTLHQLRFDLVSIDEGNTPQRLAPPSRDKRPGTSAGRRIYQAQVVLCVMLLVEIGLSDRAARSEVARIFSAFGHRGQQGRLSSETLTRWRLAVLAADGDYIAGRRMIERNLQEWKQSPMWPPSIEQALAFVAKRARNPIISLAASK